MSDDKEVSRRWLLVSIGVLLNGAVALLIATPIVGYLLGPIRKNGGYNSWIDLGDASQFPLGETRLASFVSPGSMPWTARPERLPAGCAGRRIRSSRFLRSTALTLAARCAGFPSRNCLCAPAMAGSTTPMARGLRDRRREASSLTTTKCKTAS